MNTTFSTGEDTKRKKKNIQNIAEGNSLGQYIHLDTHL